MSQHIPGSNLRRVKRTHAASCLRGHIRRAKMHMPHFVLACASSLGSFPPEGGCYVVSLPHL